MTQLAKWNPPSDLDKPYRLWGDGWRMFEDPIVLRICPLFGPDQDPRENGWQFCSKQELIVYRALCWWQKALPNEDTFLIQVNQHVAGEDKKRRQTDFLIIYRGCAINIEVDSEWTHKDKRRDKQRDRALRKAGLVVERLAGKETRTMNVAIDQVRDILTRLGRRQEMHGTR